MLVSGALMNCGRSSSVCRAWCAPQCAAMTSAPPVPKSLRIAVVGDVHYDWDPVKDYLALKVLKPDLVLFTGAQKHISPITVARSCGSGGYRVAAMEGDFGEEDVELVKSVSDLNFPKCVILGNHDCWWTAGSFKRQMKRREDPYQDPDSITAQLLALGPEHVGYGRLDYPQYQISVVGGRPFSRGGFNFNPAELLTARYGVKTMTESEIRITEMALGAPVQHSLIILAHNGPFGLGSKKHDACGLGPNRYDICGKDWVKKAGDHGDIDLARAIKSVLATGRRKIPLVVFGHMHKKLQVVGERTMVVRSPDGIVYLNAAVVPRFRKMVVTDPHSIQPAELEKNAHSDVVLYEVSDRQFTVVDFQNGELERIAEVWVRDGDPLWVVEETQIYSKGHASVSTVARLSHKT